MLKFTIILKQLLSAKIKGNVSVYDDYLCKEFLYHKVLKGTV